MATGLVLPLPSTVRLSQGLPLEAGLTPSLDALVQRGVLTGYALISVQGVAGPVVGPLAQDFAAASDTDAVLPEAAQQFLKPFSVAAALTVTFTIAGQKLQVIQQQPGTVLAVGPQRKVNACVLQLAAGLVLITTWDRRTYANTAVTVLEQLVRPYRQ